MGETAKGPGILTEIHVDAELLVLLQDCGGELRRAAVADLRDDSGLLLEACDERLDESFAASGIDGERRRRGVLTPTHENQGEAPKQIERIAAHPGVAHVSHEG